MDVEQKKESGRERGKEGERKEERKKGKKKRRTNTVKKKRILYKRKLPDLF